MRIDEKILSYLSVYGKENKYKLARALKIDVAELTRALDALEKEGRIEIKTGKVILKRKKIQKPEKVIIKEKPEEAVVEIPIEKQEKVKEQIEEIEEQPEETSAEEKPEEVSEELIQEERIEGTVKFYNPDRGFGFITGDDGNEYYVHKSGIKEGVTIEADDRVSFKVVQEDRGPKAEEVEKISQSVEYVR